MLCGVLTQNLHEISEEIEQIDSSPFFRKVKQIISQLYINLYRSYSRC